MSSIEGSATASEYVSPIESSIAALFDIDGVLVDTRQATAVALASVASRCLGHTIDPSGIDPVASPSRILANLGVPNAYQVYRSHFDAAFREAVGEIQVFHQAIEGLRQLKAHGISLGAVTAQPARRAKSMLPPEVRELFDVILCYDDTGGKKEVGIAHALTQLNISRDRAFFVGDTPNDLKAARQAGVKSAGVLWGFSSEEQLRRWPSDILLKSPVEISVELAYRLVGSTL